MPTTTAATSPTVASARTRVSPRLRPVAACLLLRSTIWPPTIGPGSAPSRRLGKRRSHRAQSLRRPGTGRGPMAAKKAKPAPKRKKPVTKRKAAAKTKPAPRRVAVKKTAAKKAPASKPSAPRKLKSGPKPKAASKKPRPRPPASAKRTPAPRQPLGLQVSRPEAPDKKAMLEQALTGTPKEGQRVAETRRTYAEEHARSLADPAGFWGEAAAGIDWIMKWDRILDDSNPPFYRWFRGGVLNTCWNALDRHVERGRGEQAALIYDSPVTNTVRTYSYRALRDEVAKFAGVLVGCGVGKGDRVILYMPMVPEALIAMFACARIGAVHSVVFGGFAAAELATRINDATPKVIVSASCGIEVGRIVPYKPLLDR